MWIFLSLREKFNFKQLRILSKLFVWNENSSFLDWEERGWFIPTHRNLIFYTAVVTLDDSVPMGLLSYPSERNENRRLWHIEKKKRQNTLKRVDKFTYIWSPRLNQKKIFINERRKKCRRRKQLDTCEWKSMNEIRFATSYSRPLIFLFIGTHFLWYYQWLPPTLILCKE